MIRLPDYLNRRTLHALEPDTHDAMLRVMLQRCYAQSDETLPPDRLDELVRAHALKDQPLGDGFALSHARIDALPDIRLTVGLLGRPHRFLRRSAVHTIFCILIPIDHSREYLALLARLSRLLERPGAAEVFRAADIDGLLSFLAHHAD